MRVRSLSCAAALSFSCGPSWSSAEDCEALDRGAGADECWATYAPSVFRTDRARGEKIVEERISDSRVRDFVWLTVTREVDPGSYRYCDRIVEDALAARCRVLVSRPHLHRELVKDGGGTGDPPPPGAPPGAGGGPAPGASAPPVEGGAATPPPAPE